MRFAKVIQSQPRWLLALLVALLAAHIGVSGFVNETRFFIPDEIVYYLTVKALAAGSLAVDTGYAQFHSPLFIFNMTSAHDGRVFAQYPVIYSALVLPFFAAFGKVGLFAVNQLCFVLVIALVYRIQMLLFASRFSSWAAAGMTAFGGFLWVYSQALAPHLLQLALLLGAAYLMLSALRGQAARPSLRYVLAGLLFGAALGVRLDSLFALPMLLLPSLFAQPVRMRALALLLPGLVLGLGVLSYTNHIKFGSYMPFSYDTQNPAGHANFKPMYLYLMLAAAALLASVWGAVRLHRNGKLPPVKWLLLAGVAALALVVALIPDWVVAFLYGFNLTVVDFASKPLDATISASASRTAGGGFMYLGEYKRALLQSAPFVSLLTLLALQTKLKTPAREWAWLCWLALVPAAFIFFFSLLRWDGGFAYHMRYYIPALPFLAMIAAQALWRFVQAAKLESAALATPLITGGVLAVAMVFYADAAPEASREWLLLYLPLWFWAIVPLAGVLAFYDGAGLFLRQFALMLAGFAVLWGGASAALIVYPHLNHYKRGLHLMSASYAHYLAPKSVVISVPRYFTSFASSDQFQVYVATIYDDGAPVTKEHMHEMIVHFLDEGTPVYITHDMKSLPYLRAELEGWKMRLVPLRPDDARSNTPALSRFEYVTKPKQETP